MISGSKKRDHSAPLFKDLKILTIKQLWHVETQMFLHKFFQEKLPAIFSAFFIPVSTRHNYATSSRKNLSRPTDLKIEVGKRSIRFQGVLSHNFFHPKISYNCSYYTYKQHLKAFVLQNEVAFLAYDS